jgi:beta-N-acetylhexosaminidase
MRSSVLRLFCVGFPGLSVPGYLRPWLEAGLAGVILFRRNLADLPQICRLTESLVGSASRPLLIGVDQEGGRVMRLPEPFLRLPAARLLGQLGETEPIRRLSLAVGRELLAAGLNWNLAPVLDLLTNPANTVIGDRAFGDDPERVAGCGLAALQGFREAGILATAKHFPGHGETFADSHLTLPESPQSAARWRAREFVPFRAAVAAGVPTVLAAHLRCPALDPQTPSSLSRRILTDILREELGFAGVVVSDDMEMGAVAGTCDVGEASVRFLEAGGDLILVCEHEERQRAAILAVEAAVCSGRIGEARLQASLLRIEKCLALLPPQAPGPRLPTALEVVGRQSHRALLACCPPIVPA